MKYIKLFENYSKPLSITQDEYGDILGKLIKQHELFKTDEIKWLSDTFDKCEWYIPNCWGNVSNNSYGFKSYHRKILSSIYVWKMEDEWFYVSFYDKKATQQFIYCKCDGFDGLKLLLKQYI